VDIITGQSWVLFAAVLEQDDNTMTRRGALGYTWKQILVSAASGAK
jgi:hypothetical protein